MEFHVGQKLWLISKEFETSYVNIKEGEVINIWDSILEMKDGCLWRKNGDLYNNKEDAIKEAKEFLLRHINNIKPELEEQQEYINSLTSKLNNLIKQYESL